MKQRRRYYGLTTILSHTNLPLLCCVAGCKAHSKKKVERCWNSWCLADNIRVFRLASELIIIALNGGNFSCVDFFGSRAAVSSPLDVVLRLGKNDFTPLYYNFNEYITENGESAQKSFVEQSSSSSKTMAFALVFFFLLFLLFWFNWKRLWNEIYEKKGEEKKYNTTHEKEKWHRWQNNSTSNYANTAFFIQISCSVFTAILNRKALTLVASFSVSFLYLFFSFFSFNLKAKIAFHLRLSSCCFCLGMNDVYKRCPYWWITWEAIDRIYANNGSSHSMSVILFSVDGETQNGPHDLSLALSRPTTNCHFFECILESVSNDICQIEKNPNRFFQLTSETVDSLFISPASSVSFTHSKFEACQIWHSHAVKRGNEHVYNTLATFEHRWKKHTHTCGNQNKCSFDKSSHICWRVVYERLMPCRSCDVIRHSGHIHVCVCLFASVL